MTTSIDYLHSRHHDYDSMRRHYDSFYSQHDSFSQLFSKVADYCYAMGRLDLVSAALQGVMQTSTWQSSERLARIIAAHVGREAAANGGGPETWSRL
jgi:hypothetical protein